jgi:hypothetical protein
LTAVLEGLIMVQYKLDMRLKNAHLKLALGNDSGASVAGVFRTKVKLAVEILISSIHTLPFVDMDITQAQLGRRIVYRLESVLCALMFVRVYHVWRSISGRIHYAYFNLEEAALLRDDKTIKILQQSPIQLQTLALKLAVAQNPMLVIVCMYVFVILFIGYLMRVVERPAISMSKYLWDTIWMVWITCTTAGYFDAVTHYGRALSGCLLFLGPLIVAFITAALSQAISITRDEHFIARRMRTNHLKIQVMDIAARMIQVWWEHSLTKRGIEHKRKSLFSMRNARNSISLMGQTSSDDTIHGMESEENPQGYSKRTEMKMAELYRKLYLAIEFLRKYNLSGVDIEEQCTTETRKERTIASLIAERQSVKKVANKAGDTNENTKLIDMVGSLQKENIKLQKDVSDMHNDLSSLKGSVSNIYLLLVKMGQGERSHSNGRER